MPTVVFNMYDKYREGIFEARPINIETPGGSGIKCAVVTSVYTVDQNLHDFRDDFTANEVTGTGYTLGGNVMSNGAITLNGAGLVSADLDDPATWLQNAGGFANGRRAIVYLDTAGADTTDNLMGFSADFGADKGNVDGDFTIQVNAAGLFTAAR